MALSATKNTAIMSVASIMQKAISFVYFLLVARTIGADGMGKYVLALSLTTIFVVFVDLGFTNVLIREAAKYKKKAQTYFSNVIYTKLFFGAFSYIAVIAAVHLLDYSSEVKSLVYISGITMLFDSLHLSIYGVLRSFHNLKYEAIGIIGSQLATLILGSIFLVLGLPLVWLMVAFLIPSVCNVIYAATMLYKSQGITLRPHYDREMLISFAKIATPFAFAAIFARVYSYADSIILSKLMSETAVGWYGVSYKITFAFQFIPMAFVAALYPRFSAYCATNKKDLARLFEKSLIYLLLIVLPIAVGIAILAEPIIIDFFTDEYVQSIVPLQILILSLIFSFLSFPIGAFLNACDKQVTQTVITGIVLVTNIILNFIFIPIFGVAGAAMAALVGNIILMTFGYAFVPQVTTLRHGFLLFKALKLFVSVALMGLAVIYINSFTHYFVAIIIGGAVYPAMVLVTRAISFDEIKDSLLLLRR